MAAKHASSVLPAARLLLLLLIALAAATPAVVLSQDAPPVATDTPATATTGEAIANNTTTTSNAPEPTTDSAGNATTTGNAATTTGNATTTTGNATVYPSLQDAFAAANGTETNVFSFLVLVDAAGVLNAANETTAWTILAPNNAAVDTALTALNTTAEDVIANKTLLTDLLSYHTIPAAGVTSNQLVNGTAYETALAGAPPLTVTVEDGTVTFTGAINSVAVVFPDIKAGQSVIHVVDGVLVPPGLV